jgi:carboxyl-terminal processing protease
VKSRERLLLAINIILLGVVLFGGRGLRNADAGSKGDDSLFDNLKTFTDVLAIVEREYVSEVESKKIISGAIKGMLSTLDPHSGYLEPEFYSDLQVQTKGEFGGLGLEVSIKDGMLLVVAPMEGSPAAKAGVLAGDVIVKIEGKFTREFSLVDAVKKLRGPKGTEIRLSISRKGHSELINFKLVRDNITLRSVRARYLGEGLGWVRISQFVERTADDLQKELNYLHEMASGQLKGLVLDLRNNPGGLLSQAVKVSDLFLDEGLVVYTQGRSGKQEQKYYAHSRGGEPKYPIVVLINGGSASASEIVAGALKEHGRALLVGKRSFGKGSVQTVTALDNGGALTLTTALYYLKNGQSIQATGVSPDVVVEAPVFEAKDQQKSADNFARESELPGAIDNPESEVEDDAESENGGPKKVVDSSCMSIDPQREAFKTVLSCDPQFRKPTKYYVGLKI